MGLVHREGSVTLQFTACTSSVTSMKYSPRKALAIVPTNSSVVAPVGPHKSRVPLPATMALKETQGRRHALHLKEQASPGNPSCTVLPRLGSGLTVKLVDHWLTFGTATVLKPICIEPPTCKRGFVHSVASCAPPSPTLSAHACVRVVFNPQTRRTSIGSLSETPNIVCMHAHRHTRILMTAVEATLGILNYKTLHPHRNTQNAFSLTPYANKCANS